MGTSNAAIRTGFAVFLAVLLAGCGGGGTDTVPPSSSESTDTSHGACTQVAGETVMDVTTVITALPAGRSPARNWRG